jgi:hypothetical protein
MELSPNPNLFGSRDTDRIDDEKDGPPLRSSQEIGNEVGVSASTIDRVRTIFEEGSEEQISALRERSAHYR